MDERGFSVATVKHTGKKISFDKKGKDSWRHGKAGSRLSVLASPSGTRFLLYEEKPPEEILEDIKEIEKPDIIFLEGYKNASLPSIAAGEIEESENTFFHYRGKREKALEAVRGEMELQKIKGKLGGLDCGKCGEPDCRSLARKIRDGEKQIDDCTVLSNETVEITVNGKSIGIKKFVQQIIKNSLLGMLRALKGVDDEIEKVNLKIDLS